MDYAWAKLWTRSTIKRFFSKIRVVPGPPGLGDCWLFDGAKSRGGQKGKGQNWYGSFWVLGKWTVRAHIFVCVVEGRMRKGHHVDHVCENTMCVRPLHLEVVTPLENELRKIKRREARSRIPLTAVA